MLKLKPKDLEIGDIVKVKFSKQEIECYGFVAEKNKQIIRSENV